jgi:hypothetical protein
MDPEVNQEIKDLKYEIKELRSVLRYLIEQIEQGTPLTSESIIVKICKSELETNK